MEQNHIHITVCPICESTTFVEAHTSKDYTVSQEVFHVKQCVSCGFKCTSPRPVDGLLGRYYQSEEYVSHSKTKKGIVNRIYHLVKGYTLRSKRRMIQKGGAQSLLDFGCGTGDLLGVCAAANMVVRGAEPDDTARANCPDSISDHISSPSVVLQEDTQYDRITLWHVMEHLPELSANIEALKNKLAPAGIMIIAVPNHRCYDALHYKSDWAAWDVPRHLWHFSPNDIERLAAKHEMELFDTKPMWFDSTYVSMLSEKNRGGSFITALFVGLYSNLRAVFSQKPTFSSQIYFLRPQN